MPAENNYKDLDAGHFSYASLSHCGRIRKNNEDRLAIQNYPSLDMTTEAALLAVLCDGVGGHQAGEIAAQIGVESVVSLGHKLNMADDPALALRQTLQAVNLVVVETSATDPVLGGMGATCIAVLIKARTLYLANLGDSRAYLLSGRKIRQLSSDHTLFEDGQLNGLAGIQAMTRENPLTHVLSRYLGGIHPAPVDTRIRMETRLFSKTQVFQESLHLHKGERILLCSDGLTDMLDDEEVSKACFGKPVRKAVQALVLCALKKGGKDNVSVILIEIS